MSKVAIDMSISLDGFVAGPDDGKDHPLGRQGGEHVFDSYFSGTEEYRNPLAYCAQSSACARPPPGRLP